MTSERLAMMPARPLCGYDRHCAGVHHLQPADTADAGAIDVRQRRYVNTVSKALQCSKMLPKRRSCRAGHLSADVTSDLDPAPKLALGRLL